MSNNLWQPNLDTLNHIIQLITYTTTASNMDQLEVHQKLQILSQDLQNNNYLAYILVRSKEQPNSLRSTAGFLLKKNISSTLAKFGEENLFYIKNLLTEGLSEQDALVRNTVTIVISVLLQHVKFEGWPDLVFLLVDFINNNSNNYATVEGSLATLEKICEDAAMDMENVIVYKEKQAKPVEYVFPVILNMLDVENIRLKYLALKTCNNFIIYEPAVFINNLDYFLTKLFKLAELNDVEIRKLVCQSFVMILEVRAENMFSQMNNIVNFMLQCTTSSNENIALEACEFWLAFVEHPDLKDPFINYLNAVLPVLINCMKFGQDEIVRIDAEQNEPSSKAEDIKPVHHSSKAHTAVQDQPNNQPSNELSHNDEDEDDDEYYSDEDDEDYAEWSLRKCAAAALDVISTTYNDKILPILLPLLKEKLFRDEWLECESGILALGAISEGCIKGMSTYLPDLIPFLLQKLHDSNVQIRVITAWTLGRYTQFYVSGTTPEHKQKYLLPVLENLLRSMLDDNKKVQESSCGAIVSIEEEASAELVPFIKPILQCLAQAFTKYNTKNLISLYDAIGALADGVGLALSQPDFIQIIIPPLIAKWNAVQDFDYETDFIALLECMSSVILSLGQGFTQFSQPIYQRCIKIIAHFIEQSHQNPENSDPMDKEYITVCLDLISSIIQALTLNSAALVANDSTLLQILIFCLKDENTDVKQSAYALLGDLAMQCFNYINPHLDQIMNLALNEIKLKPDSLYVCNNAVWSCGEISLKMGKSVESYAIPLLERMMPLLVDQNTSVSLRENLAISIGRISTFCPQVCSPHLDKFCHKWCIALRQLKDNSEKESAINGFCEIIMHNPSGLSQGFHPFCELIVEIETCSKELKEKITNILHSYKNMLQDQFQILLQQLTPETREKLQTKYGL